MTATGPQAPCDAYTAGMTVSPYDLDSAVAADYRAATDHLLSITKGAH